MSKRVRDLSDVQNEHNENPRKKIKDDADEIMRYIKAYNEQRNDAKKILNGTYEITCYTEAYNKQIKNKIDNAKKVLDGTYEIACYTEAYNRQIKNEIDNANNERMICEIDNAKKVYTYVTSDDFFNNILTDNNFSDQMNDSNAYGRLSDITINPNCIDKDYTHH
jgi:hypothetical protein